MHQFASDGEDHGASLVAADPAEYRAAPRHTLLIRSAKLVVAGAEYLCVVRDVSETGVSLRLFHELPLRRVMELELQNADRLAAELVWQQEDRVGLRFRERVDVHRLIEMPAPFARRPIRVRVSASGVIGVGDDTVMCALLDLSQHGAKVACSRMFAIDQRVRLVVSGMPKIQAKVRWREADRLGLSFENTFQLAEFATIVAGFNRNAAALAAAGEASSMVS